MRKHLFIAATAAVVSLPTFANSPYIAVDLAIGEYNTSAADNIDSKRVVDQLDHAGSIGLKAGKYINDNVRVYGYLQYNGDSELQTFYPFTKTKFELEGYQMGVGSDYLYHIDDSFYLLAGGSIGYYKSKLTYSFQGLDEDLDYTTFSTSNSNSGVTYGLNAGLGYMFTDHFGMEAGYRFNYYAGNEHKVGDEMLGKFKSSNQGYLNATYKF